jgi:hypothetical protein
VRLSRSTRRRRMSRRDACTRAMALPPVSRGAMTGHVRSVTCWDSLAHRRRPAELRPDTRCSARCGAGLDVGWLTAECPFLSVRSPWAATGVEARGCEAPDRRGFPPGRRPRDDRLPRPWRSLARRARTDLICPRERTSPCTKRAATGFQSSSRRAADKRLSSNKLTVVQEDSPEENHVI